VGKSARTLRKHTRTLAHSFCITYTLKDWGVRCKKQRLAAAAAADGLLLLRRRRLLQASTKAFNACN
jgi:hypothetical protein